MSYDDFRDRDERLTVLHLCPSADVVDAVGGTLAFETSAEGGTTAVFRLPVAEATETATPDA